MSADRFEVDTDQLRSAAALLAGMRDRLAEPTGAGPDSGVADAGLDGWSCASALSRLDSDWSAAVRDLADGYADHADQLRAAAERYDDVTRVVAAALSPPEPPC